MSNEPRVVRRGAGEPLTLFAPSGAGENLEKRMRFADQVTGTTVGFLYSDPRSVPALAAIGRQADRDAAEVSERARDFRATQAIGVSRGARAILGALGEDVTLFQRVALVAPPAANAAGAYAALLQSRTTQRGGLAVQCLVIGYRGDRSHPAQAARTWAEQLGAQLEIFSTPVTYRDQVASRLAEFLS